jgi:hypothetical protein
MPPRLSGYEGENVGLASPHFQLLTRLGLAAFVYSNLGEIVLKGPVLKQETSYITSTQIILLHSSVASF